MLLVPAHSVIDGVTVYADDERFDVYYLMSGTPSVRRDANGKPVFLLVKYEFSAADRAANPSLPTGGGYLNFDTALTVDAATLATITTTLQAEVDAEWNRRRNGSPAEQASQGVTGTTAPPAVSFDTPTFTKGKVALDVPQATELVSARVAEGSPTLLDGSGAVFNLDLTPAGATFMQQALVGPGGSGATDLTPIQVAYDLSFWARLPPAEIAVTADSQRIHEYIHKQLQGRGIDWCTTYDFDHTDLTSDTVTASGAITVSIDQGSGSLPADVLNDLRNYALDLVKQMITSSFFTSQPSDPGTDPAPSTGTGQSQKFYLRDYESASMSLNVHLEQRSVVEWEVFPQATIESFFSGVSAPDMNQFIRLISLEDPFWETLDVTVRVFADWTGPVSWVRVDLEYDPPGTDPRPASFTFDATHTDPQKWTQNLTGGDVIYRYRTTVAYKDQPEPAPTAWITTSLPAVNVEAVAPAVAVTVLAGDVDFDSVDRIEVTVAYQDAAQGVSREEETLVLTGTNQQQSYKRLVYHPITQQPQYRARFTLKSGDVQDDPAWHPVACPQLVINQDRSAVLRVSLLPTGNGWSDVERVMVDLHYEDTPNAYTVDNTIDLETIDQFRTWTVPLKDKTLRSYSYKWTASFKNGHLTQTTWQPAAGDSQTLPVAIMRPGIDVLLVAEQIDFKATPVVEVACHYSAAGFDRQETLVFQDASPQTWSIDVPDGSPVEYTWQVTFHPQDADPVTTSPVTEHDNVVIIPPYRASGGGELDIALIGGLVDYTATPIVGVDLTYDDDAHGVHVTGSFVLDSSQPSVIWKVQQKDRNATQFSYTITYFTPDGAPHAQSSKSDTVPRVVVPRFHA
jgi:hypothetical protein